MNASSLASFEASQVQPSELISLTSERSALIKTVANTLVPHYRHFRPLLVLTNVIECLAILESIPTTDIAIAVLGGSGAIASIMLVLVGFIIMKVEALPSERRTE